MIYKILKNLITNGVYNKEDMINKLNVFFAFNQINKENYMELLNLVAV